MANSLDPRPKIKKKDGLGPGVGVGVDNRVHMSDVSM